MESGAREQWAQYQSWIVDVLTVTVPSRRMYWGDLTGELLDSDEVEKARKIEIEYSRDVGVYKKVPIQQAQEGGHRVLGVGWVDLGKADGSHRSRLGAKEIKT